MAGAETCMTGAVAPGWRCRNEWRSLQVGDLHGLERSRVGLAERTPEHALREIVAPAGVALGARALDDQLVAVSLVSRARQGGLADHGRVLDQHRSRSPSRDTKLAPARAPR